MLCSALNPSSVPLPKCSDLLTLHSDRVLKVPQTQTTVLFWDRDTKQTHVTQFRKDVLHSIRGVIQRVLTSGMVLVLSISTALGAISFSANEDTA